ncbi:MAG: TniQ family protein [Burkholderiaceae bacterium]
MIIPELLPDELAEGYFGRIQILNSINSERETLLALQTHLKNNGCLGALENLAKVAKIPFSQMINEHTLIPFTHAFGGTAGRRVSQERLFFHELDLKWIRRRTAFFCLDCIKEDLSFHGVSYWRRTHHLHGINWCVKHGTPLYRKSGKNVFAETPANECEHVVVFDVSYVDEAKRNIVVQKYVEICCDYLEQKRPRRTLDFSRKIRGERGKNQNEYNARLGKIRLSEQANSVLPRNWLLENFPKVATKLPGEFIWSLDGLVRANRNRFATEHYALADAIVSSSTDDGVTSTIVIEKSPKEKTTNIY